MVLHENLKFGGALRYERKTEIRKYVAGNFLHVLICIRSDSSLDHKSSNNKKKKKRERDCRFIILDSLDLCFFFRMRDEERNRFLGSRVT